MEGYVMKILITFDSMYGCTEKVAHAIKDGFGELHQVEAVHISHIGYGDLANLDLLVVGSPTHGGRETEDVKTFLDGLSDHALRGVRAAAFDTSMAEEDQGFFVGKIVKWFGHAATRIERALTEKGAEPVLQESFLVLDKEGPLKEGELERARDWASHLFDK
ncbi:flavodoxin family protein [Exiguobacterium sp. SH3S2]|nr:flavodoxin family protein [Exiguobacterium sp. SH5S4]TCI39231.1 flavodoxin family protein [Exiguobacterium sp. SH4S7]TCI46067.1 flavodoxin family protein [Exiguobacterium sp. SH3S3]TCI48085.1 flavodoxin family protein [Exiguobacterium sp. SH5S32]TCI51446.1 flavodoxin family protein [Exiguobacterium sp. SH5S13]TCI54969.1 flavodoxin family protein [Exiguobacterium sp. SH1S4]TCI61155.1 flavodoxin family protein [Exiguobacterium sp. SH3S2]TCI62980.1 flavodoxin family protein [Exiguobacterium 